MSGSKQHHAGPDKALRADRDQARQELAETASELAGKLDVQARTKDKVQEIKQSARTKAGQAKHKAETAATHAKHKAEDAAAQAQSQAQQLAGQTRQAAPEPVVQGGQRAMDAARNRPVPLAAAVAVLALLVWLIMRRRS